MSARKGNWVDRFDPIEKVLVRILAHAFDVETTDARLDAHAVTIRGMVEADAGELHVASFVRTLHAEFDHPEPERAINRLVGIALWHAAKAGLVRDRAERRAQELMRQLPPQPTLAENLREAILRAPAHTARRAPRSAPTPDDVHLHLHRDPEE